MIWSLINNNPFVNLISWFSISSTSNYLSSKNQERAKPIPLNIELRRGSLAFDPFQMWPIIILEFPTIRNLSVLLSWAREWPLKTTYASTRLLKVVPKLQGKLVSNFSSMLKITCKCKLIINFKRSKLIYKILMLGAHMGHLTLPQYKSNHKNKGIQVAFHQVAYMDTKPSHEETCCILVVFAEKQSCFM